MPVYVGFDAYNKAMHKKKRWEGFKRFVVMCAAVAVGTIVAWGLLCAAIIILSW